MKRYEVIIIGAGPAGLSAAAETARAGMSVAVFDENAGPGGQLFKQIHKFFGSGEHNAKIRGFRIGQKLLREAKETGAEVFLNAVVTGIYGGKEVVVRMENGIFHFKANYIIIAAGAAENVLPFDGWDLPGVMSAGAAQTLMNLHGIQPGERILMVGSGNVGLIVAFQLLQAGCSLAAVVDAAPRIGGYGVHAAKIARTGVPFLTSHTIVRATGKDHVETAVIAETDENFKQVAGSEKQLQVDTILLAVGLTPMNQLAKNAGCRVEYRGGGSSPSPVTVTDFYGETTVKGIFCCGDSRMETAEGASSAILQGCTAAVRIASQAGYLPEEAAEARAAEYGEALKHLSGGMFAVENKGRTDILKTQEDYAVSQNLLRAGYMTEKDIHSFPAADFRAPGIHPVIECTQNIPCNPCGEICAFGCIRVKGDITSLPERNEESSCTGCGMCVTGCPGQAIFLIDREYEPGFASVGIPYEFLPLPEKGTRGEALDRSGRPVCRGEIISVRKTKTMDGTALLTMKVPLEFAGSARFFRPEGKSGLRVNREQIRDMQTEKGAAE